MHTGFVWLLAAFSSAGGLFQGYAIGLVNALSTSTTFLEAFPDLLPAEHEHNATPNFVFYFVIGTAAGAMSSCIPAMVLGRKATIILGALIGVGAGLLMAATPVLAGAGDVSWLYLTRFISGISVGALSVCVPLYQSEVAPVQLRGRLMATFQLAVTLGILCAVLTDYVLAQLPNDAGSCERYALCHQRWRLVLALVRALSDSNRRVVLRRSNRRVVLCRSNRRVVLRRHHPHLTRSARACSHRPLRVRPRRASANPPSSSSRHGHATAPRVSTLVNAPRRRGGRAACPYAHSEEQRLGCAAGAS